VKSNRREFVTTSSLAVAAMAFARVPAFGQAGQPAPAPAPPVPRFDDL
jgi:hypothetical protein